MSALPIAQPIIETRPRLQVVRRTRPAVASTLLGRAALFVCLAGASFAAASLAGHVGVERARREGIRSAERARDARIETASLQARVEALRSISAIQGWAVSHGFVGADQAQPKESLKGYVALNR